MNPLDYLKRIGQSIGSTASRVYNTAANLRQQYVVKPLKPVWDFLTPKNEEEARRMGLIKLPHSNTYLDPTGGVGSLKRVEGQAAEKLASKVIPFIEKEGAERATIIGNAVKHILGDINPAEVIKVRKAGNGTVKITRGELEVMKQMQDLKPSISDNWLQNPIRVFEEMGPAVKELFYRPVKVAEHLAAETKTLYNEEFNSVIKGLKQDSSRKIMQYAVSQEPGQKIVSKAPELTPKEMEVYQYIRTRYDALLEELNGARAIAGKTPIAKRDNYITHIRDLNILEQMGFSPVRDDIEQLLANKVHRNATAFQWAKRRTDALVDIENDAFNVFRKYQEKALDHINLTPALVKVRELSRTILPDAAGKEGQFKLIDHAPQAFKYITEWTDHVAGQKIANNLPPVVENLINKLSQNNALAALSSNIQSAVIQPSSIINTLTELGTKNTSVGIKALLRGEGQFALENSNVLKGRAFDSSIQDIANSWLGSTSRVKRTIGEKGLGPLQVLDNITAQSTWLGAYNRAVSELGYSGKKAYNFADDVVTKTQASAARSDVAKAQRGTLGKAATQFQTFVINDFNRLYRDVLGVGNKEISRADVIKKASTYVTAVTLWNMMSDQIGIPTPFPRPLKALKEQGPVEAGKQLLGQLPIVGGGFRYGSTPLGANAQLVADIAAKVDGKYTPSSWWEIAAKVFGVPGTAQLKKTISGVKGLSDGYTVTTNDGKRIKITFDQTPDQIRALLFGPYNTVKAGEARKGNIKAARKPLQKLQSLR